MKNSFINHVKNPKIKGEIIKGLKINHITKENDIFIYILGFFDGACIGAGEMAEIYKQIFPNPKEKKHG